MCQTQTQSKRDGSHNICDHGAYADLCITCHPVDCETVQATITYTKEINVAAVDRKARAA